MLKPLPLSSIFFLSTLLVNSHNPSFLLPHLPLKETPSNFFSVFSIFSRVLKSATGSDFLPPPPPPLPPIESDAALSSGMPPVSRRNFIKSSEVMVDVRFLTIRRYSFAFVNGVAAPLPVNPPPSPRLDVPPLLQLGGG